MNGQLANWIYDGSATAELENRKLAESAAPSVQEEYQEDIDPYKLAYRIVDLVNEERESRGREALGVNEELMEIAMIRAEESDYCAPHKRQDGSCFSTAVPFSDYVGENLMNIT